jgi:hypothetical protein
MTQHCCSLRLSCRQPFTIVLKSEAAILCASLSDRLKNTFLLCWNNNSATEAKNVNRRPQPRYGKSLRNPRRTSPRRLWFPHKGRVPHISLVFREMWDTAALSLWLWIHPTHLAINIGGIPHFCEGTRGTASPDSALPLLFDQPRLRLIPLEFNRRFLMVHPREHRQIVHTGRSKPRRRRSRKRIQPGSP